MKARIATLFATAVAALTITGGALAAPQHNSIHGWDYTRPGAVKPNPMGIRGSYDAVKPNPWSIRLVKPNPSCIRGAAAY